MKKIDLHIHTLESKNNPDFKFNIDVLKQYIASLKIDCIAITNHNKFDIEQFNLIISNLSDIDVYPGIEINLEKTHLLLISDNKNLKDFDEKCQQISKLITNDDDNITVDQLKNIFDLSQYILIPHYKKDPEINNTTLSQLYPHITAGEVSSPKKFMYCIKDQNLLVPVIFSDIRIAESLGHFSTKQTFLSLEDINFENIKTCLRDKNKVHLSLKEGHKLFQILENGLEISVGLTVILGKRSSGKSYMLDQINETSNNIKYIKQFSLLEKDEEKFNLLISDEESLGRDEYLKEFKEVVEDVLNIDLVQNEKNIDEYISSLIQNANDVQKQDVFSKATLFNEKCFLESDLNNLQKIIKAIDLLIQNKEYEMIINKYISKEKLCELIIELINKHNKETETDLKAKWINKVIKDIKSKLQLRTAIIPIKEDIDFCKIIKEKMQIDKFIHIVSLMKKERGILEKDIKKFKLVAKSKNYTSASDMQKITHKQMSLKDAYTKYSEPYEFLLELKKILNLEKSEYYKYFVSIKYTVLNKDGYAISGGERSEFNLLKQIDDAKKYDMLLIDEPESSFDNFFLNTDVKELIKRMSEKMPVILVTHNNTIGVSFSPDYIVYTKKDKIGDDVVFKQYFGVPADKQLFNLEGESINNFEITVGCLEAGQLAYDHRREFYEILKNR